MSHRSILFAAALTLMTFSFVRGEKTSTPDEPLTSAGLAKVGSYYLLDIDQHLNDRMKEITAGERQNAGIVRQQRDFQSEITAATEDIADLKAKVADLEDRKGRTSVRAHSARGFLDEQIKKYNEQIKADDDHINKDKTDSADLKPVDVGALNSTLADDMDAAADSYAQLQKDSSITDALAAINSKPGPKVRLGPSVNFQQALPRIRAARAKAQHNSAGAATAPSGNS